MSLENTFSIVISFISICCNVYILTSLHYMEKRSASIRSQLLDLIEVTDEYVDALENSIDDTEARVKKLEARA